PPTPCPLPRPDALPTKRMEERRAGGAESREADPADPGRGHDPAARDDRGGSAGAEDSLLAAAQVDQPEPRAALAVLEQAGRIDRSEEHTSELQSPDHLV